MAEREGSPGNQPREHGPDAAMVSPPTVAELRDVNERLLITGLGEQELAAVILADMGDAVLVVGATGAIVRTNAAYARMAGGPAIPLAPQDAQGHALPPADTPQRGRGGARRSARRSPWRPRTGAGAGTRPTGNRCMI